MRFSRSARELAMRARCRSPISSCSHSMLPTSAATLCITASAGPLRRSSAALLYCASCASASRICVALASISAPMRFARAMQSVRDEGLASLRRMDQIG